MEETAEFFKESFGGREELNLPIDIDDAMVAKDNDGELQKSESNTNFVQGVSHDPILCERTREKVPHRRFEIEVKYFTYALFEDYEPASIHYQALSSPTLMSGKP